MLLLHPSVHPCARAHSPAHIHTCMCTQAGAWLSHLSEGLPAAAARARNRWCGWLRQDGGAWTAARRPLVTQTQRPGSGQSLHHSEAEKRTAFLLDRTRHSRPASLQDATSLMKEKNKHGTCASLKDEQAASTSSSSSSQSHPALVSARTQSHCAEMQLDAVQRHSALRCGLSV